MCAACAYIALTVTENKTKYLPALYKNFAHAYDITNTILKSKQNQITVFKHILLGY